MATSLATKTTNATDTAVMSAARWTQIGQSFVASEGVVYSGANLALLINPYNRPGAPSDDPGWLCEESVGGVLRVVFHADPQRRTVYLCIDRDNAPLTGNYVIQINALTAVTYNATAAAPADVDALLAGIVAAIQADGPTVAVVTPDVYAMSGADGAESDAIRLRAVVADETAFNTFIVASNTAFPGGAALTLVREITDASLRVWTRPNHTTAQSVVSAAPLTAMTLAWAVTYDVGELDEGGKQELLNLASCSAIWLELYDPVIPSDTYASTTIDIVAAYIAPALTEAPA